MTVFEIILLVTVTLSWIAATVYRAKKCLKKLEQAEAQRKNNFSQPY